MSAAQRARPDVAFPRRVVTRPATDKTEAHDAMTPEEFALAEASGQFALSWRAHGLAYGIPVTICDALDAGRTVVVNVSRGVIADSEALFHTVAVLNVTARPEILARRIAARGRESAADIASRLSRDASVSVRTARVFEVGNNGTLEEGVASFLAALARAETISSVAP